MTSLPLHLPAPDRRPLRAAEYLIVAASLTIVWILAWGHPLYPPDEGRYGSVAAAMAEGGSWIVPSFRGNVHLTKPPLAYWLQALGVELFGRTAIAVRLPSLVATTLALAVLFVWIRRGLGTRPAVIAAAVSSITPLTLVVGRLASTDAILSLTWVTMLASAWFALDRERGATVRPALVTAVFWLAFAVGLLTKGPAALGPIGIIGVWLLFAGRLRDVRTLRPWIGFPLAVLPTLAWMAALALHSDSPLAGAGGLWWDETIGRVTGENDLHGAPFWFYLAVVVAGAYPATTFLTLPLFNLRFRDTLGPFRQGDLRALLLVATVLPLVAFSLSVGKVATYMLPLIGPMSGLAALTLERWLRGEFDVATPGYRPPEVRWTLAIVATLVFLVELSLAIYVVDIAPDLVGFVIPLAIAPIACWILVALWKRGPHLRAQRLAVAWLGLALAWTLRFGLETRFMTPMGMPALLERVGNLFGSDAIRVATIGFDDPTIAFYNHGRVTFESVNPKDLLTWQSNDEVLVVLVPVRRVDTLIDEHPEVARLLEPVATWRRWFGHLTRVYVLRPERARITS